MHDPSKRAFRTTLLYIAVGILVLLYVCLAPQDLLDEQLEPSMAIMSGNSLIGMSPIISETAWRILWCESRYNFDAIGQHGEIGWAQIKPRTWEYFSNKMGLVWDIQDPHNQLVMLEWAIVAGYKEHWVCK